MSSSHVIDECRVELKFRHERQALEGQGVWETLVRDRLLAVAEAVFDEVSEPGKIRRIDALSIDLGGADPRTNSREIERRMREQLHAALRASTDLSARQAAREQRLPVPAGGQILTRATSDIDQLQQFLQSGQLPWHSQHRATTSFDAWVRHVLETKGEDFARWLRAAAQRRSVVPRLVRQFPEDVLEAVGFLLLPGHGVILSAMARELSLLFAGDGRGMDSLSGLNRMVWEALLDAALESRGPALDTTRLAREAIKRLARLRGVSHGGTAAALRLAIERLRSADEPGTDVGGAWHALRRATALDDIARPPGDAAMPPAEDSTTTDQPASGETGPGRWRQLSRSLERAVVRGDATAVRGVWHRLLRQHAAMVIGAVRRHGVLVRVRRRMAEGLPEAMLQDIVNVLEPLHSDFIAEFVHRPELFQAALNERGLESQALRRRTWEFTLAYLLVERGSGFNREAYLGSVVRQMAAHDNLDYRQLLKAVIGVLEDVETGGMLHAQMLALLRRLEQRAETTATADSDDGGTPPGVALLQGAMAYDETVASLLRGLRIADDPAGQLGVRMEQLVSAFPWQFLRLARELEASPPLAARIAAGLPLAVLQRLVFAVMALEQPQADAAFLAFRASLDRYILHAPDPQRLLARVLTALLARRAIDLEALALNPGVDDTPLEAVPRSNAQAMRAAARQRLRVIVEGWIRGAATEALATAWSELVQDHPALLQSILRRRGRSEQVRRDIAYRASETMLRDMARVLEPVHGEFIAAVMRHPEQFQSEAAQPAVHTEHGRRRLWMFTLGYLLVDRGGQFNRKAYLGSLVRQIAAHDNLAAADFVSALVSTLGSSAGANARQLEMVTLLTMIAVEMGAATTSGVPVAVPAVGPAAAGGSSARGKMLQSDLRALLDDWIGGGPADVIAPVWDDLVHSYPKLLRSILRSRGRSEPARQAIAYRATASMLDDIVHVLEPAHADFIQQIMQRRQLFPIRPTMSGDSGGQSNRRLWVFTLGYLLADRGGAFNRKSYLANLMRRIAAHDNLSAEDVVRAWIATLTNMTQADAFRPQILALVREIAAESGYGLAGEDSAEKAAIATLLMQSGALSGEQRKRFIQTVEHGLVGAPQLLRRCLMEALQEQRALRRLVAILSESLLTRVLALICPADYASALRYADIIATALLLSFLPDDPSAVAAATDQRPARNCPGRPGKWSALGITRWKWQCVLRYLVAEGRTFDGARFSRYSLMDLRGRWKGQTAAGLPARLLPHLARSGTSADRGRIEVIAAAWSALAGDGGQQATAPAKTRQPPVVRRVRDAAVPGEALQVTNAGQVLAAPYMPQLFAMLQLTADGQFVSEGAAQRAVHLLQYMVDGSTDTPEHLLTLNKILCGVPIDVPLARDVFLTDKERQTVESMIQGMIQNWTAIGTTSVGGLRESFLQREGRLKLKDDHWHLLVAARAFDMLLDRIPWGFATIKHAWMHHIVHVDWR